MGTATGQASTVDIEDNVPRLAAVALPLGSTVAWARRATLGPATAFGADKADRRPQPG